VLYKKRVYKIAFLLIILIGGGLGCYFLLSSGPSRIIPKLDGSRMYEDVRYQTSLGARVPNYPAHETCVKWIVEVLQDSDWQVEIQQAKYKDVLIKNIIAQKSKVSPRVILGAHYDSRRFADQDISLIRQKQPVLGANDGASGVAVLLELGRVLPRSVAERTWLVFFDAEDNGGIDDWEWSVGSQVFVCSILYKPEAVVILDMVGDSELTFFQEGNSDVELTHQIWEQASDLGYSDIFIPKIKYTIYDDHIPFMQAGIPAVDVIDFGYPAWHTNGDTLEKISPKSLQITGEVIYHWLLNYLFNNDHQKEPDNE